MQIVVANKANQLLGFRQIARHRLLADDVDSALKKRLGDRKMELRRGRDDDRVDPVGTFGLALQHKPPVRVRPVGGDHMRLRRGESDHWLHRHRAGHQFAIPIRPQGQ